MRREETGGRVEREKEGEEEGRTDGGGDGEEAVNVQTGKPGAPVPGEVRTLTLGGGSHPRACLPLTLGVPPYTQHTAIRCKTQHRREAGGGRERERERETGRDDSQLSAGGAGRAGERKRMWWRWWWLCAYARACA